jgi:hypothetical protein
MKTYTRLRDFLENGQPNVPLTFEYKASFRIFGHELPIEEIERTLPVFPVYKHRRGEIHGSSIYKDDMWRLDSPLSEHRPIGEHLDWLWLQLKPHKPFLLKLKQNHKIDVFVGYESNCDMAGVEIPIESMSIYYELAIPFGLSIIVC